MTAAHGAGTGSPVETKSSASVTTMQFSRLSARMCRRPACQGSATATLSFSYDTAEAILYTLIEEPHPSRWDLCTLHADTLRVPRGWNHIDQRPGRSAQAEPPAGARRNRYADLSERLPEIARDSGDADRAGNAPAPPQGAAELDGPSSGHTVSVDPSLPDEPIPGQLVMPLTDVGFDADTTSSSGDGSGFGGNVVPLLRREAVLDPVP